jgi:WD40 repeat protein
MFANLSILLIPLPNRLPGIAAAQRYQGHTADINTVAWTNDGVAFATGSDDHSCRLWFVFAVLATNMSSHASTPTPAHENIIKFFY